MSNDSDLYSASFGQKGVTIETGTTPVTGTFHAIQILETANFAALSEYKKNGDDMTGFDIAAGIVLFGSFNGFTLTSGKVRAYHR